MRRGAVRLVAGELGGRSLEVPGKVRPTARQVREALFSIWGDRVRGARCLDLFAGSGAVGCEALSRGAAEVGFVESSRAALAVLRSNLGRLGIGADRAVIHALELPRGLTDRRLTRRGPYGLVFADPPYRFVALDSLVEGLPPLLAPAGEVVVEHSGRVEPPAGVRGLELTQSRRYGDSRLSFYRAS